MTYWYFCWPQSTPPRYCLCMAWCYMQYFCIRPLLVSISGSIKQNLPILKKMDNLSQSHKHIFAILQFVNIIDQPCTFLVSFLVPLCHVWRIFFDRYHPPLLLFALALKTLPHFMFLENIALFASHTKQLIVWPHPLWKEYMKQVYPKKLSSKVRRFKLGGANSKNCDIVPPSLSSYTFAAVSIKHFVQDLVLRKEMGEHCLSIKVESEENSFKLCSMAADSFFVPFLESLG